MDYFELAAMWIFNYAIVYACMFSGSIQKVVTTQTTYERQLLGMAKGRIVPNIHYDSI